MHLPKDIRSKQNIPIVLVKKYSALHVNTPKSDSLRSNLRTSKYPPTEWWDFIYINILVDMFAYFDTYKI